MTILTDNEQMMTNMGERVVNPASIRSVEKEVPATTQIQDLINTINTDVSSVLPSSPDDSELSKNTDLLLNLADQTQRSINKVANSGNKMIAVDSPTYLKIEPERWNSWEFAKWEGNGGMEQFLRGEITAEDLAGKEISPEMAAILDQMRPLEREVCTGFGFNQKGEAQYQVTPIVGDEGSVDQRWVSPPDGNITFDIHNHPSNGNSSYPFFSGPDLIVVLSPPSPLNETTVYSCRAVAFREGTAFVVKTPETQKKIDQLGEQAATRSRKRQDIDVKLHNSINIVMRNTKQESDIRDANIQICKEYHMGLFFVPKGERVIQTVYNPTQPTAPSVNSGGK